MKAIIFVDGVSPLPSALAKIERSLWRMVGEVVLLKVDGSYFLGELLDFNVSSKGSIFTIKNLHGDHITVLNPSWIKKV